MTLRPKPNPKDDTRPPTPKPNPPVPATPKPPKPKDSEIR